MVIAHSLGSSVTGHAFRDHPDLYDRVDNLMLVGSPGVPQSKASEFGTDVVVAIAPDDVIHLSGNAWSEGPSIFTTAGCLASGAYLVAPEACDAPNPWDSEFGADVYWAPNLDYPGWFDGVKAHGTYLDTPEIAYDLVARGFTGSWPDEPFGSVGYR